MSDTTSPVEPVPVPVPTEAVVVPADTVQDSLPVARPEPDPTRYGDWEKNGRCIDF